MGMYEDQIRQRKRGDQEVFEDSILRMASAVVGSEAAGTMASGRIVTKEAVDDILKFYHINPVDIPSHVKDPDTLDEAVRIMNKAGSIDYARNYAENLTSIAKNRLVDMIEPSKARDLLVSMADWFVSRLS